MVISLPKDPEKAQYEDFVTAYVFALGYFVETRLKLVEGTVNILELDVVATPSSGIDGRRVLFEAKSGSWGFPDVFKLAGWIKYLGIPEAVLIHRQEIEPTKRSAIAAAKSKTAVGCLRLDLGGKVFEEGLPVARPIDSDLAGHLAATAWYSQTAQRLALAAFTSYCNSQPKSPLIENAIAYQRAAERSFFEQEAGDRVLALYRAYQANANVSGGFVAKLAADKKVEEKIIWNEANGTGNLLWLQFVMQLEHRARLAILKAASDIIATRGTNEAAEAYARDLGLPNNFISGIAQLRAFPEWNRVPYLFQILVDVFGGFYWPDEVGVLAKVAGMQESNVEPALSIYSTFFPFPNGCFFEHKGLKQFKLMPAFLRGIGSFLRHSCFGLTDYQSKYPDHGWLLSRWHDVSLKTCARELAVPPPALTAPPTAHP